MIAGECQSGTFFAGGLVGQAYRFWPDLVGLIKRTSFVLIGATVALVLAWGGIHSMLVPYLILLGTFIPPVGGVVMADY